jgi:hypothetical protein
LAGITKQQRRQRFAAELAAAILPKDGERTWTRIHVQLPKEYVQRLQQVVQKLQQLALPGAVVTRSQVVRYGIDCLYREAVGELELARVAVPDENQAEPDDERNGTPQAPPPPPERA